MQNNPGATSERDTIFLAPPPLVTDQIILGSPTLVSGKKNVVAPKTAPLDVNYGWFLMYKGVPRIYGLGDQGFLGGHIFLPLTGRGTPFFGLWQGGARKILTPSEKGLGFFCITQDEYLPRKGSKTHICMF